MPEVQQQPPVEGGPFGAVVVFDVIGTLFSTERAAEAFQILGMAADAFELALADALRDAFAMSLAGGYAPFAQVLEASLRRIAERHGLPAADPAPVIDAMQRLDPVEGAVDAVTRLNESGVRLVTLTNSSVGSTRALLGRAGIVERFDALLSCDEIEVFKPHPGRTNWRVARRWVRYGWLRATLGTFRVPAGWGSRRRGWRASSVATSIHIRVQTCERRTSARPRRTSSLGSDRPKLATDQGGPPRYWRDFVADRKVGAGLPWPRTTSSNRSAPISGISEIGCSPPKSAARSVGGRRPDDHNDEAKLHPDEGARMRAFVILLL